MKINIVGQFFGTSGYANHTRNLANALGKKIDVKITTMSPPNWEKQVNDLELQMLNKPDSDDRINLIIDLPYNWPSNATKENNIGFLVWEGDKIPKSFIENIEDKRIKQVWVPSHHVFQAIKNTYNLPEHELQLKMNKIHIIPHGVDLNLFNPIKIEKEIFTIICNKGFRNELDRGGIQHAIKSFIHTFDKGEARMILKINPAYMMSREQIIQIIKKYSDEVGKEPPEILINDVAVEYSTLKELYSMGHIFLNPTEAEAFSLPCLEAMSCGIPVITTNFGGQTDYVDNNNGWLLDYQLTEVKHDLFYEGINWAKPDLKQLGQLLKELSTNQEIINQKGLRALETAKNWTWDNSADKAINCLNQLN